MNLETLEACSQSLQAHVFYMERNGSPDAPKYRAMVVEILALLEWIRQQPEDTVTIEVTKGLQGDK